MRAKGIPMGRPAKDIHLGEWHPGDLVGFDELFHDEREDQYVLGGRRYWAYTFHCPDRGCRCGEARVAFFDDEAELSVSVGSVVLHLGAGERRARVVEKAPEGGAPANLIGELWALFRRRHDVGAYLRRRDARVRSLDLDALRPPAAAPGRPAARPGRNDPCPCGSGRKFKKCCLGKDAEPGEPG
jgi:hypothetical protein